jgi:hypothetical protein
MGMQQVDGAPECRMIISTTQVCILTLISVVCWARVRICLTDACGVF